MYSRFYNIVICFFLLLSGCKKQEINNSSVSNTTPITSSSQVTDIASENTSQKPIDDYKKYLYSLPKLGNSVEIYQKSSSIDYSIIQQNSEPGTIACENDDYMFFIADSGFQVIQIEKESLEAILLDINFYKVLAIAANNDYLFLISMLESDNAAYKIRLLKYRIDDQSVYEYEDNITNISIFRDKDSIYSGIYGISSYNDFTSSFKSICNNVKYNHIAKVEDGFFYYSDDYILHFSSVTNNEEKEKRINSQNIDVNVIKAYNDELFLLESEFIESDKSPYPKINKYFTKIDTEGNKQRLFFLEDLNYLQSMIVENKKIYFTATYDDFAYILCFDYMNNALYKIENYKQEELSIDIQIFAFYLNNYLFFGGNLYNTHFDDLSDFYIDDYFLVYSLDGNKIVFRDR